MFQKILRVSGLIGITLTLVGCGLPRGGPNYDELVGEDAQQVAGMEVIAVTDRVARITKQDESLTFSQIFQQANLEDIEVIRPGDTLDITIWENTDVPLYGVGSGGAATQTPLADIRVSQSGYVFIPQIGRLKVSGLTLEQFRRSLTARLDEMTPDPQVEMRLTVSGGNVVKIFGNTGIQGNFPIEARTRTLSGLIAEAGGVAEDPEVTKIQVRRGPLVSEIWLEELYADPRADISLKGGDVIVIERDQRSFTALGALGAQTHVNFDGREISLLQAIGGMGGLNNALADPKGVFVLREEAPETVNSIIPGIGKTRDTRVAYIADLTKPAAMFTISEFMIRDNDLIYVTEAPYVAWMKVLNSIAPPVNSIQSTTSLLSGSATQ